jgi:hypothetical protein
LTKAIEELKILLPNKEFLKWKIYYYQH